MFKKLAVAALACALFAAPAAAQQSPDASQAQDLTNCAGAVGAVGGGSPLDYPVGRPYVVPPGWPAVMSVILDWLNREEGMEGMTGRYAADAARREWQERPRAEQQTAAEACRERYAS